MKLNELQANIDTLFATWDGVSRRQLVEDVNELLSDFIENEK